MLFIDAILSKNQLYKDMNQINKVPTISKQENSFPNISACHFTNVCNLLSCYHNGRIVICRYQGVTLRNNNNLFWEFFLNLSAVIRAMLELLIWLKLNFYSRNFKNNKYNMGAFWCCYLEFEPPYVQMVY